MARFFRMALLSLAIAAVWQAAIPSGNAQEEGGKEVAAPTKWDCVTNATNMRLKVYVIGQNNALPAILKPKEKLNFVVLPGVKQVVVVAYEYNTNNLVAVKAFVTLPQAWPPKNCYPITKTTTLELDKAERADHDDHEGGPGGFSP